MNNRSLGCLSPTAIIASLVTFIVIIALEFSSGNSLFSAGGLNAHAGENLGGVISHAAIGNECGKCHVAFWEPSGMSDRCAACHTEISTQISVPATMHGAIMKNQALACRNCHPEHRGSSASLTDMQVTNFPHDTVGYSLRGHERSGDGQAMTCPDCHGNDVSQFDQATCASCHQEIDGVFMKAHTLAYASNCLACHDGLDSLGEGFDHNTLAFKLEGKHTGLTCSKCHLTARSLADFKSTPVNCSACHHIDDPHNSQFGQDCGACHSVNGWKPAKFDHNLSAFKLEGKHASVECSKCHLNGVYKGTSASCFACHQKDDEHNGKFGQECGTCHTPTGWDEATFDHNLSNFKLEGKHVEVACEKCHVNGTFKGTPAACFACHEKDDEHNGKFGQECGACHTPTNWGDATFDHNLSAFKLDGAHAQVTCEKCHINGVFKGTSPECSSCHGDPVFHAGMFRSQVCSQCHNTNTWSPAIYNGPHPGIADEGGSGVNHGGEGCRSCHTVNLSTATCLKCHDSNNPDGGGGND